MWDLGRNHRFLFEEGWACRLHRFPAGWRVRLHWSALFIWELTLGIPVFLVFGDGWSFESRGTFACSLSRSCFISKAVLRTDRWRGVPGNAVSSWKRCDFRSIWVANLLLPGTSEWKSRSFIHSFIHLLHGASGSSEGRCGVCPYTHRRKSNNREIFTQTINGDSDQCYKEAVKDVMGVLDRKA